MHFTAATVSLLGLAVSCFSLPTSSNGEVFERLSAVPEGWTKGQAASESMPVRFRIAVRQERAGEFEQKVIDMSTPEHADYGKHMSKQEMKAFLRPSAHFTDAVLSWLRAEDISDDKIEEDGDWITFIAPVSKAERMLDTEFFEYHHAESDSTLVRTLQYSLPAELHGYISMIQPTTRFGVYRPQRSFILDVHEAPASLVVAAAATEGYDAAFCNSTITPDCLRGLYGLGNYTAGPNKNNTLGISGYLEELGRYADLDKFKASFAPWLNTSFNVVAINNGPTDQSSSDGSGEANLDVQYALATAGNAQTVYYSVGGRGELVVDLDQPTLDDNSNEPYLELLNYLINLSDEELPKVLTTSYGEDEQSIPVSYANSTCNLFAQLGSRGVSVIFSSGDTGVGSACQTNDAEKKTRFLPIFPASCPFVTSVGGTYRVEPERAISFSSGGFSDLWERPAWQDAAVSAYLEKLGDRWDGLYNPNGRGFPDVAAQSYNFSVYDKGRLAKIGGTSASAPAFAGIISALNDVRGSPLGYLNPWIYSTAFRGLTDIVDGGSRGCTGRSIYSGLPTPIVPYASWNATEGWDPVTGYGTPNFPELVSLLP